jgi:hypothetical protein
MTSPLIEIEAGLHHIFNSFQDFTKYLEMTNELTQGTFGNLISFKGRFDGHIEHLLGKLRRQITIQQNKRRHRRQRYKNNKRIKEYDNYDENNVNE